MAFLMVYNGRRVIKFLEREYFAKHTNLFPVTG